MKQEKNLINKLNMPFKYGNSRYILKVNMNLAIAVDTGKARSNE